MQEYLKKAMAYSEYLKLIDRLLEERKTTGPVQSDAMFHYAKLNRQRIKRLDSTVVLDSSLVEKARRSGRNMIWLIITEGWCGDAAQNIPIIEKIAASTTALETRYLLRDENPELMDRYLTGGARSIPKLIALDSRTLEVVGSWGPRPAAAMNYFLEMREQGLEKTMMMENMQRWYIADKNQAIQHEFSELFDEWTARSTTNSIGTAAMK
jgi:Thioredoxin